MAVLFRKFVLFLVVTALVATWQCSPAKENISQIDIDRVLSYLQRKRFGQQVKNQEFKTDRDILFEAIDTYNLDRAAVLAYLKKKKPNFLENLRRKSP